MPKNQEYESFDSSEEDPVSIIIKKYQSHPSIKFIETKNKKGFSKIWYEHKHSFKNAAFFAKYIYDDINTLIRSSKFHNELKEADIVPVHKKKSKYSKENYRPISILPNISKIYERCIWPNINFFRRCFLKVSTRFSQGLQCTTLPVSCDRKVKKNSGLWRCLWCIINRLI